MVLPHTPSHSLTEQVVDGVAEALPEVAFYGNNGVGYDALAAVVEDLVVVGVVADAVTPHRTLWNVATK